MYCMKCGYENAPGQTYCIRCGARLADSTVGSAAPTRTGILGLSLGKKVSATAALVALVCFFLPWITVSCGTSWSLSGYDLATFSTPSYASESAPGSQLLLFIVPLVAVLIVAAIILAMNQQRAVQRLMAIAQMPLAALGGLVALVTIFYFEQAKRDPELFSLGYLMLKIEPAPYLTVLAFASALVGSFLDLRDTG